MSDSKNIQTDQAAPERITVARRIGSGRRDVMGPERTMSMGYVDAVEYIRADLAAPSAPACYTVKDCLIDVSGGNYRAIVKDDDGNLLGSNDTGDLIMFSGDHVHLQGLHILSPEALERVISNRISELSAPAEVDGLVERLRQGTTRVVRHYSSCTIEDVDDADETMAEAATALTALQADKAALIEARDMMGRIWEQEKARAEKAEAERDAWKTNAGILATQLRVFSSDYDWSDEDTAALDSYENLKGDV